MSLGADGTKRTIMRTIKFLSVVVFAMFSFIAHAQDVIVKKDGNTITSKVIEITSSEIKYKKFSNQNGPTYTINRNEVNYINYENGEKETINASVNSNNTSISFVTTPGGTNASDTELLNNFYTNNAAKKAKKLKKTAYIGGGILLAASIPFFALNSYGMEDHLIYAGALAGAGFLWTGSFLLAAQKQNKKAAYYANNVVTIMQMELFNSKQSSLYANIDMFNDNITHKKSLGLGFHFNF